MLERLSVLVEPVLDGRLLSIRGLFISGIRGLDLGVGDAFSLFSKDRRGDGVRGLEWARGFVVRGWQGYDEMKWTS